MAGAGWEVGWHAVPVTGGHLGLEPVIVHMVPAEQSCSEPLEHGSYFTSGHSVCKFGNINRLL